jgi:hypothetical protein
LSQLSLQLSLEKASIVRGESIPFSLILSNEGPTPLEVESMADRNETVTIDVAVAGGDIVTLHPDALREDRGEPHGHNYEPAKVKLTAKGTSGASGDLLRWGARLAPGQYTLLARYEESPMRRAESKPVQLTVTEAAPIGLVAQPDPLSFGAGDRTFTWFNKSAKGAELFIAELDAFGPTSVVSNRPLHQFKGEAPVVVSHGMLEDGTPRFTCWLEGSTLRCLVEDENRDPQDALQLTLDHPNLVLLRPALCDEEGHLALCAIDREEGAVARLMRVRGGRIETSELTPQTPLNASACLCWSDAPAAQLAWRDDAGAAVWTASCRVTDPVWSPPRKLSGLTGQIRALRMDNWPDADSGDAVAMATVITIEVATDRLTIFHMDAVKDTIIKKSDHRIVGISTLGIAAIAVSAELEVRLLLKEAQGRVRVWRPGEEPQEVNAQFAEPLRTTDLPVLFPPRREAKVQAFPLVYVKAGKELAIIPVE